MHFHFHVLSNLHLPIGPQKDRMLHRKTMKRSSAMRTGGTITTELRSL